MVVTKHQEDRHQPDSGTVGTNLIPVWQNRTTKPKTPPYSERCWSEEILRWWHNNTGKNGRSADEDTNSHGGKSQGIEQDRRLGRKLRENTVRGGEAWPREEWNNSSPQKNNKRAPIDPTPLPKTHKLGIDLRSPIAVYSSPNPPSHLHTASNITQLSTEHSRSTSAAGCIGSTAASRTGRSSHAGSSSIAGPWANCSPNHVHNLRQFIKSLALAITKEKKHIPLLRTMGAPGFIVVDITKLIEVYQGLSSGTWIDQETKDVTATVY